MLSYLVETGQYTSEPVSTSYLPLTIQAVQFDQMLPTEGENVHRNKPVTDPHRRKCPQEETCFSDEHFHQSPVTD